MPRRRESGAAQARTRAVALIAKVISDPVKRRAFADDPDGTIEAELGDDAKALPPKVRAFFRELTYEELRVLAQLQQTMKGQAGLYEEVQTFRGTATHLRGRVRTILVVAEIALAVVLAVLWLFLLGSLLLRLF